MMDWTWRVVTRYWSNTINTRPNARGSSGSTALSLMAFGLVLWIFGATANAQDLLTVDDQQIDINLTEAKFLRLEEPAKAVFLSNPTVADIDFQSAKYIYLVGRAVGESTLFVLGEDGEPMIRTTISVGVNTERLSRAVNNAVSGGVVSVDEIEGAIFLNGQVDTAEDLLTAEDVLAMLTGEDAIIVNRLELAQSAQVNLQVKIAEVSRNIREDFGLNLTGSGSRGNFTPPVSNIDNGFSVSVSPFGMNGSLVLDALSRSGLVTILSEPNLTTRSGETAEFLAGGQIPFRVGDSEDDTRIQLENVGVELEFTPRVHDRRRIEVKLKTRVREVDTSNSASSGDIGPALTERSASTTVEIGSGQSFAIAGLFQSSNRQALQGFPGLAKLPIIGALFRSSEFSRGETELIIIVTPYLVDPTDPDNLSTTFDEINPVGSGMEQWGTGRLTRPSVAPDRGGSRVRPSGAGFRLQ